MSTRGAFIVLEGIDGAGTTTQSERLAARLRDAGASVVVTNQPSGGPIGSLIRQALTRRIVGASGDVHGTDGAAAMPSSIDATTMALLFAADRQDHVMTVVEPGRAAGRHVICDRYLLSSLAYQGTQLPAEWILEINRHAPVPDITLFLDVDVDVALERMRRTRWTRDVFENRETQLAVRDRYHRALTDCRSHLGRVEIVDASRDAEAVASDIWRLVAAVTGT